MANFLDIALKCIRRGWFVHPLKPCDKVPITEHGKNDATRDEAKVQAWWADMPKANVGISCAPSGLCVLDADHGLMSMEDFTAWRDRNGLPVTYAVRSGRRPEFGVQSYYAGHLKDGKFELDGVSGDIKSAGGLVLAAGCIHPDSKEEYKVIVDAPIVPVPDIVDKSRKQRMDATGKREWALPVHDGEGRDDFLTQQAGRMRNVGASEVIIRAHLEELNSDPAIMADPKSDEDLDRIARSVARYDVPAPDLEVTIGNHEPKPKPPGYPRTLRETLEAETDDVETRRESMIVNWRGLFHTKDDVLNCPEPTYFIQDFLQHEAICGIAAPVGQRKSLIALNVARSLCIGEPLFGFLPVVNKPSRVLYLCPEMGLISMSARVRNAGLTDCLDDTLLLRSMNFGGLDLLDLNKEALKDSVLILDTAIRFVEGDENSAKDMRIFSDMLFGLQRLQGPHGAIIILYHSPKTTKDAFELTLENCLRGSGELGASLTDCWGTRMQEPEKGWDSLNFISHVKVRDYAGPKDFEVFCDKPTGIMSRVGDPDVAAVLVSKKSGPKVDPEEAEKARAFIKANPNMTVKELMAGGQTIGINHKRNWWTDRRMEARVGGCVLQSE